LAFFLADFRAGLAAFSFEGEPLLPEKMLSQLSEYCFVAPTRTTLMAVGISYLKLCLIGVMLLDARFSMLDARCWMPDAG
jgi:hypothetical protein